MSSAPGADAASAETPSDDPPPKTGLAIVGELLWARRGRVVLAVVATLVSTAAALVPPYLAGRVVNDVVHTGSSPNLVLIAVALAAALGIGWIAGVGESWLIGDVGQRALMDLRMRILAHLHRLPMRHYDGASTGRLISRLTNDVEALNALVAGGLNRLISSVLVIVGTVIVMVLLDWRMALVSLFVFPLLGTASIVFQRLSRAAWADAVTMLGRVTSYAQEGLAGQAVVRGFAQEERHLKRFEHLTQDAEAANARPLTITRIFLPATEFTAILGVAAVIGFGAHEVIGGALNVGVVVSFTAYLRQALAPIPQLASLFVSLQQGAAALDNIAEVLDEPPDPGQLPGRRRAPRITGQVSFERIWFAYEDEKWVLRDVDLEVETGQTVALVGHSGCGKSTLVKLALCFYAPQRGRVAFDGLDAHSLDQFSLRGQIGFVPQEPFLFAGTIAENLAWREGGTDAERLRVAREAADAVGVREVLAQLPQGFETEVGERGERLSAGQRQLVALARATVGDPRLLILDEATSNIDVATETQIQRGIERLMQGRSSIVVAHRLSTIRRADRIVVFDHGQIVEAGTPAELRASGGHYAQLEQQYESEG